VTARGRRTPPQHPAAKAHQGHKGKRGAGELRLIGGRWRGRRLPIIEQPGLRPTADRTRETLFNWLAPVVDGSRCLDCFAGAGALGLEAASRGAARVVMIEQSAAAARQLRANVALLSANAVEVIQGDAIARLGEPCRRPFDIVFLDPPFGHQLVAAACGLLARGGWVSAGSLIYLEMDVSEALPALPTTWALTREKRAGQVRYALAEVLAAVEHDRAAAS
jgi:16S rRNA (guanine966-N2)-methyltransferase